jgi:hypothetical protein
MQARFRSCRSRRRQFAVCSRGSVQWSGPIHGRGETESAPVHLRPPDISARIAKQVVGREPIVADPRGEFLNYVPNQLLGHSVAPGLAGNAHLPEELSCLKCLPQRSSRSLVGRPNRVPGWFECGGPSQPGRRLPSALRVVASDRLSIRRSHAVGGHTPEELPTVLGHAYLGAAQDLVPAKGRFPARVLTSCPA